VGYDVKTKAPLPGFSSTVDNRTKLRFSETERVRCKSLAEETRLLVAEVMSGEDDVVDYDENEYVPQRSTRARTEARSDSVEAADSTSQSFQGVETIKAEEIEEEDYDFDSDSSSEDDTAMNSTKRKAGDMAGGGAMSDEPAEKRRVKVEEDEDSTIIYLKDLAPACKGPDSPTTKPPKSGDKGQFHWALDEDDDEDDEDQPNANGTNVSKEALPSPQPPGFDPTGGAGDNEARGGDGELYEDDEEEEELQMNVGKVYEKTLAHLGQTLGESLTGD
jgi:hypothetical protein